MKIKIDELPSKGRSVTIQGDEAWLDAIYKVFHAKNMKENRRIQGSVQITADDYGFARVTGEIRFVPLVDCSRCSDLIPWSISREFDVEFRPEVQEFAKELDLNPEELDHYYLDDQARIDLELLINDLIQTAFPTRVLLTSEDGQSCLQCHADLTKPLVVESDDAADRNPFAVLRNIKLDS
ncbi:MAG: YceD family protein [Oligoflexus sp.]